MNVFYRAIIVAMGILALPPGLLAQKLKPETLSAFECYVQSAEKRMDARQVFLLADADATLNGKVVGGHSVETVEGNGANPHKVPNGLVFDWVGTVFIPGTTLDRTVRMLQDYDHRDRYFSETISTSKLHCRKGENQFHYSMRLKEPAVVDVDNDVVWERADAHRWRCRSYSTEVRAVGKDKGYLRRHYSYWRFVEVKDGVYVEGKTITMSDEFGTFMRALGSMMGINPEKSLRHSLESMRESLTKPGMDFPATPTGLTECGEPYRTMGCMAETRH
jgi:hypothetical protein